jgi:CHAD domain-containing protein
MHVPLEPELSDLASVSAPAGNALFGTGGSWSLGVEDRQQPAARVLALLLAGNLQQFRSFEFSVLNDLDPEQLHDFRVSLRRARSLLSSGGSVFPGSQRKELLVHLAEFGRVTSRVRDLDVLLEDLPKLYRAVGLGVVVDGQQQSPEQQDLRTALLRNRSGAFADLAARIDPEGAQAAKYQAMLRLWYVLGSVHRLGGDDPGKDALRPSVVVAQATVLRQFGKVRSAGRAAKKSNEVSDWHRLRKRAKALRYGLVAYAPLLNEPAVSDLVSRLRKLQNVLGLQQDHAVQIHLIELAGVQAGGRTALLAGAISEQLRLEALKDLQSCSAAWSRFDQSSFKDDLAAAVTL